MNNSMKMNGYIAILIFLSISVASLILSVIGVVSGVEATSIPFACIFAISLVPYGGFLTIQPNQARVFLLFGKYIETFSEEGFHWVNPFLTKQKVSLRIHNIHSAQLKVNDKRGNPIELAAVVVWRVNDPYKALLNVHNYTHYVDVQIESALRHLAISHPYDHAEDNETSLSRGGDIVEQELNDELRERLKQAGVEIIESRISHLAYAPEIAGVMLQRQQADAVISARAKIVEGAIGIVRDAVGQLERENILKPSDDQKAFLVNNLLTVICSDQRTQPVLSMRSQA